MRKFWLISCAVLLLASWSVAQGNSDEQAIRKLDAEYSPRRKAKNVEKTISFYADDAVFLPDDVTKAEGKAKIKEMWTGLLGTPGLTLTFTPTKIEASSQSGLATTWGLIRS